MDSATETEPLLLLHQNPNPNPNPNPKPKFFRPTRNIVLSFLLLLALVAAAFMLYSYLHPIPINKPIYPYLLHAPRYYCHVTPYPDLCFQSMSPTLNSTSIASKYPTPIFTNSIRIAIKQLNATELAITAAAAAAAGNKSYNSTSAALWECGKVVSKSLSRVKELIFEYGEEFALSSVAYEGLEDVKSAAEDIGSGRCSVMEVKVKLKVGVLEEARKCMLNCIALLEERERIESDYYKSIWVGFEVEDYYWRPTSYYQFDYGLVYFVYSVQYLFLGFLYFLLCRGDD